MAARNRARAKRRNEARTKRNALALDAAVTQAVEKPLRLVKARTRTRLEELEARGVIYVYQREAGDRLAKDYSWCGEELGNLVARYAPWSPKSASPQIRDSIGQVDARRRFEKALQAVGKWLNPVLVHTCLCDLAPCHWAEAYGRPAKDGIAILRLALDALLDHYGMQRWERRAA